MPSKNDSKKLHFDKRPAPKISQNLKKKEPASILVVNRRKRLLIKAILFFVVFLIVVVLIITILRLDKLKIKNINVRGNSFVSSEEINNLVKNDITGNYFFIIPKNNILIYPKEEIKNNISVFSKRIENVSISMSGIDSISVDIDERKTYGVWCFDDDGSCYFIDKKGYIFDKASIFSNTRLKFYGGDINKENPIGNFYLHENDLFKKISVFIDSMRNIELNSRKFISKDDGSCEIYLDDERKIIINKKQDLEEAFENLKSVVEPKDFDNKFEYIDLRFGNKIFYK